MIKLLLFVLGACFLVYNYSQGKLISSSSLWVACYELIFVICPVLSAEQYYNENLIDVIAIVSFVFFVLGSIISSGLVLSKVERPAKRDYLVPHFETAFICLVLLLGASAILAAYSLGISNILAVFSGALTSKQLALGEESSRTALLGWAQQLQIPLIVAVWMSAKTKKEKRKSLICLVIFAIEMAFFSFTRLFLICVLLIILLFELRKMNPRKQAVAMALAVAVLGVAMVSLNFIRCMGLGSVSFEQLFNLETILDGTDFAYSYAWFDKLLMSDSPHITPLVYLRVIFAFVPRGIWPEKPETLNIMIMREIDPARANAGVSAGMSILGEAYSMLDYAGFVVYPIIWGVLCTQLDKTYYGLLKKGVSNCFFFFFFYVFCSFVLISGHRGDWGTYIIQIVWCYLLPMYLLCRFRIGNSQKHRNRGRFSNAENGER